MKLIDSPNGLKKPVFYPLHQNYKCLGFGYFYDGKYGFMSTTSHLWDAFNSWHSTILGWFGFVLLWNCDGTGKCHIKPS